MPRWSLCMALVLAACGSATPSAGAPTSPEAASIDWAPWGAEAFERARRGPDVDRRCRHRGVHGVLLDVRRHLPGRRRRRTRDAHFVAVAVDADLRPDLGERSAWGWPATIVLTPEGTQVHAIRGNRRPRNFIPALDELLRRHGEGTLEEDAETPIAAGEPDEGELSQLCSAAVARVDRTADHERGGFGRRMRGANAALHRAGVLEPDHRS